jgi:hypothetical protein
MSSPIAFLGRDVLMSMRNAAPEKASELDELFGKWDISFELDEFNDRKGFSADVANRVIIVRQKRLERLWAIAFAYYRFYREVSQQKVANQSVRVIDLTTKPELVEAGLLLKWAIESFVKSDSGNPITQWPDDLPRPKPDDATGSDEECASELFLAGTSFVLHHEVAHIVLAHEPYTQLESVDCIRQEKDADYYAVDWMLDGLGNEFDPLFQKRALGVCVGLISLSSLYIHVYAKEMVADTHPPAYDRLYQVIERHVHDPDNLPWAFVATSLAVQIQNQNVEHDVDREFDSFKDAADYYIDIISKMYR